MSDSHLKAHYEHYPLEEQRKEADFRSISKYNLLVTLVIRMGIFGLDAGF